MHGYSSDYGYGYSYGYRYSYLVVLCMTMSAPWVRGRCSGGGAKVLSTTTVTPPMALH